MRIKDRHGLVDVRKTILQSESRTFSSVSHRCELKYRVWRLSRKQYTVRMTETLLRSDRWGARNVGKSTIFNRLTGTRRSIVTNELESRATASMAPRHGRAARSKSSTLAESCRTTRPPSRSNPPPGAGGHQRRVQLLLVVDVRAGLTPLDAELARLLRRTGKPLAILANKVDTQMQNRSRRRFTSFRTMFFLFRRSMAMF